MSNENTGGPAFPTEHTDTSGLFDGMTLRDYFAAKVLAGMVAVPDLHRELTLGSLSADHVAQGAYALADAMLKARSAG